MSEASSPRFVSPVRLPWAMSGCGLLERLALRYMGRPMPSPRVVATPVVAARDGRKYRTPSQPGEWIVPYLTACVSRQMPESVRMPGLAVVSRKWCHTIPHMLIASLLEPWASGTGTHGSENGFSGSECVMPASATSVPENPSLILG
jgi:hypothetical protein